jgi:hypothetical protein
VPSVPTVIVPLLLIRSIKEPEALADWAGAEEDALPPSPPQAAKTNAVMPPSTNFFNIISPYVFCKAAILR